MAYVDRSGVHCGLGPHAKAKKFKPKINARYPPAKPVNGGQVAFTYELTEEEVWDEDLEEILDTQKMDMLECWDLFDQVKSRNAADGAFDEALKVDEDEEEEISVISRDSDGVEVKWDDFDPNKFKVPVPTVVIFTPTKTEDEEKSWVPQVSDVKEQVTAVAESLRYVGEKLPQVGLDVEACAKAPLERLADHVTKMQRECDSFLKLVGDPDATFWTL